MNQTWPSCWAALPSDVRANDATKYAPPSPHHMPSSLRLRVICARRTAGARERGRVAIGHRDPLDAVARARLGRDGEVGHVLTAERGRAHRLEPAGVFGQPPQGAAASGSGGAAA